MNNRLLVIVRTLALTAFMLPLTAAQPAKAWVKYCNGTSEHLWTAIHVLAPAPICANDTKYAGWWGINPGQCVTVSSQNQFSYPGAWNRFGFYAENDSGSNVWNHSPTDGGHIGCASDSAMNQCAPCDSPPMSPFYPLWYGNQLVGTSNNWTLTFVP
jgi:uncharacterized membrane protein